MAVKDEWFSDSLSLRMVSQGDDKKAMEQLAGKWIVEVPELQGLRDSQVEGLKSFLSRQVDSSRLAFGHLRTDAPRQTVIIGTTNAAQYLKDDTGNRRFWPVKVTGPLQREWLASVRDQLWAEAVTAYRAGEDWHLNRSEDGWRQTQASQYQEHDPWTVLVAAYAKGRTDPFTTSAALEDACKVPKDRQGFREMARLGAILRRLGFYAQDGHAIVDTKRVPARVWRQPASVSPIQGDLMDGTPESPDAYCRPPTRPAPSGEGTDG